MSVRIILSVLPSESNGILHCLKALADIDTKDRKLALKLYESILEQTCDDKIRVEIDEDEEEFT